MNIPQQTIEHIKERTDITELAPGILNLRNVGETTSVFALFTRKTPSFSVSPEKQICHCFGCKKGGTVFNSDGN